MTYLSGLSGIEAALNRIADAIAKLADAQRVTATVPAKKQLLVDQASVEKILVETTIDTEHD